METVHIKISGILNDEEETVLFMIHDNGVGMTRAQIEKALDPLQARKAALDFPSVHKQAPASVWNRFWLKDPV